MGGIKISVHPLFVAFGFFYALTGRIFVFAVYTASAILHELGHSFVAAGLGYRLDRITLMPFGAVVAGSTEGLKAGDEIKIALAGPFLNLAIALFFVAVWWIFPESYAYTDLVAEANFALAAVNFIPVFPLDGGRVLSAVVAQFKGRDKANKACKITGAAFAVALFALFVASIFYTVNFSLLFFSLFVLSGAFGKSKDNKYIKIYTALEEQRLMRGMPYVRQALSANAPVKKLISILDPDAVNEVVIFDGGRPIVTLSQERIMKIISAGDVYSPVKNYLSAGK